MAENTLLESNSNTISEILSMLNNLPEGRTGGEDSLITREITEYSNPRVTNIGNSAFRGSYSLTTVDFPNVTSIGNYAFARTHLTTVNFPNAISISVGAFQYCTGFITVSFPNVTSIGNYGFRYSSLTTADFPKVTSIGSNTFYSDENLTTLVLRDTTQVCKLSGPSFQYTPIESGSGYIYVPSALVDSYKAATNWVTYADQIRAIEDYPDICGDTKEE